MEDVDKVYETDVIDPTWLEIYYDIKKALKPGNHDQLLIRISQYVVGNMLYCHKCDIASLDGYELPTYRDQNRDFVCSRCIKTCPNCKEPTYDFEENGTCYQCYIDEINVNN